MKETVLSKPKIGIAIAGLVALLVIAGQSLASAQGLDWKNADLTSEQQTALQEAAQSGDRDAMHNLLDEYGIERHIGARLGGGCGGMFRNNEEAQAAIEATDYEAFVAALPAESPLLQDITKNNFDRFVEMQNAMEAGDLETAQSIREELGIEPPQHTNHPHARGGHGRKGKFAPTTVEAETEL